MRDYARTCKNMRGSWNAHLRARSIKSWNAYSWARSRKSWNANLWARMHTCEQKSWNAHVCLVSTIKKIVKCNHRSHKQLRRREDAKKNTNLRRLIRRSNLCNYSSKIKGREIQIRNINVSIKTSSLGSRALLARLPIDSTCGFSQTKEDFTQLHLGSSLLDSEHISSQHFTVHLRRKILTIRMLIFRKFLDLENERTEQKMSITSKVSKKLKTTCTNLMYKLSVMREI